jgi:hypothetical protein
VDTPTLAWPLRVLIAGLFCAVTLYAVGGHLLPWAIDRLPLAAPLAVFFAVGLISIVWATVDVVRGRV